MSYRRKLIKGISTMFIEVDEETLINASAIKYITYSMTYDKYQIVFRDDDFINISVEKYDQLKKILLEDDYTDELPKQL